MEVVPEKEMAGTPTRISLCHWVMPEMVQWSVTHPSGLKLNFCSEVRHIVDVVDHEHVRRGLIRRPVVAELVREVRALGAGVRIPVAVLPKALMVLDQVYARP